jgi:hypothetical protein
MSQTPHPEISIIIPTHNCARWLPGCIASIGLAPDLEIIVFDDGSTDGTASWLAQAARQDSRIVIMKGEGVGPAKARNRAIAAARAPLLAFLDADDLWYPGKLDQQLALHRRWPETAFSFTDYRHVTVDGIDHGGCFAYWPRFARSMLGKAGAVPLGGDAVAQLYSENVVGTSTVIARTDLVRAEGGFSEDLPSSEDWDLWLRLAKRGPVMCLNQVLADYLMHRPGNATGKMRTRVLAMRMIGARHASAVRKLDRGALLRFNARVIEGEAEIAQAAGQRLRSVGLRLGVLAAAPSWRGAREVLAAAVRACRRT